MTLEPEHGGELILEIESERYSPSDPRWLAEVEALSDQLERQGAGVKRYGTPKVGEKGPVADLLLNIVASGGGQIAATAILVWVSSYRDRRVKIRRADGESQPVTVQGTKFDEATLRKLAADLERLAGGQAAAD
jgi:hypothetical protein